MRRLVVLIGLLTLAACGASTPTATGLGAAKADWSAHHADGYTDVLVDEHDRVTGFNVTMSPRSLADAEALIRRELPADATAGPAVLAVGVEGTKCEIVDFTSPALGKTLGSDQVMAVFSTAAAVVMDTTKITHVVVVSGVEHYPHEC